MIRWAIALMLFTTCATASAGGGWVLDRIDVRLFRHHTGTLSPPILKGDVLWNTVIGEGDAGEPSTSTMVDVVVSGPPGEFDPSAVVELIARHKATGAVFLHQSKAIGVLDSTGVYHVGFWLDDTGCSALQLGARLRDAGEWIEVDIPFECGE